jgi:hypothetical protein
MNIEVNGEDVKLIKVALSHYYFELADEKKLVKEKMSQHPVGGVFHKLGNFREKIKDINKKLASILTLEQKIFGCIDV